MFKNILVTELDTDVDQEGLTLHRILLEGMWRKHLDNKPKPIFILYQYPVLHSVFGLKQKQKLWLLGRPLTNYLEKVCGFYELDFITYTNLALVFKAIHFELKTGTQPHFSSDLLYMVKISIHYLRLIKN